MSTWIYFVCIDHEPPLEADAESGQHNEINAMRELVTKRHHWLALGDAVDDIQDRYTRNGVRFLRQHPSCRLACKDEYGRWTDLGQGLPPDVRTQ